MTSDDKLTIDTPEQTALEFPLAGIGSRFMALAVDTLIQFITAAVAFIVLLLAGGSLLSDWDAASVWVRALFIVAIFLLYYGYFTFFEAIWNGQTPGKRWTKIRVMKDSGRSITIFEAMTRNLVRLVDSVPGIYAVGIISVLVSRQNKRLGDYAAGTVVVHERPFSELQYDTHPAQPQQAAVAGAPLYAAARLSADELQLIETFLQRRARLTPEVRQQMAKQISDRMAARLGMKPEERPGDEAFLEALARERRGTAFTS